MKTVDWEQNDEVPPEKLEKRWDRDEMEWRSEGDRFPISATSRKLV